MKKILTKLVLIIITSLLLTNTLCAATIEELLPVNTTINTNTPNTSEQKAYDDLPHLSPEELGTSIIKTLLAWSIIFTVIAIVVAGVYYLTSEGEEDKVTKAKSIIIYLIIGAVVMGAAYGVVTGLSQLNLVK